MYNETKGYGFITPSDGSGDLFTHIKDVVTQGVESLSVGMEVRFEVRVGNDGRRKAVGVEVLGDEEKKEEGWNADGW